MGRASTEAREGILAATHQVLADEVLTKIGAVVSWLWTKVLGIAALFKSAAKTAAAAPATPAKPA